MTGSGMKIAGRFSGVVFLFFMTVITGGLLHAQTAAEMDELFSTRTVSFAQASRFVLAAADVADERPDAAYALAREKGWLPKKAAPDSPIRLGELCFLIMKAFNIKGSFLYALFPGPRYAFRELDYLSLAPGRRDPSLRVSGDRVLGILDMVLNHTGEPFLAADPAVPIPAASVPAAPVPEVPVPAAAVNQEVMAEREQIAGEIRVELDQHEVADTTVRVVEEGVVISLNNIRFMPDSIRLMDAEQVNLREIAVILSQYPGRKIFVGGHTALAGSEEGRQQISTARAQAVADFLITLNVRRAEDIMVRGFGAAQPLGDNATEEGQAINRRVEIILMDEERP
jgi:outer membrane protein OmpA-like peptidoglycan-associated protein